MDLLSLAYEGVLQERLQVLVADQTPEPAEAGVVDREPRGVTPGVEHLLPVRGKELAVLAHHLPVRPDEHQRVV